MSSIYPSTTSTAATSSTASSSILRISGMASGIDTDAVVKSMLSSYQLKIDKADQAKQTLAWQQDAYRDIITGIKGLQDYFDPLSSKYMLSGNTLNTNSATILDSSVVSGTVDSTAKTGTYGVNITQLAQQATLNGASKDSLVSVSSTANWNGKDLTFDVGGVKVILPTLNANTTTANLVADINSKIASSTLKGKITASYVKDGNNNEYIKFTKASSNTDTIKLIGTDNGITDVTDTTINSGISASSKLMADSTFSAGTLAFNLTSGTTPLSISLTVDANTTMQNLMDQVNSSTSGAVTMSLDDTTGKVSFQSKSYGSISNISITDGVGDSIINKLGLTSSVGTGVDAIVAITAPGQAAVTTTQSSNKFKSNGVTYNLVSPGNTSVTVAGNSDTVVNNIKSFITDYNTIISSINTKLTEKPDPDYPPLTDAQRATMSDTQITAWEAKSKVGVLRNDSNLSSLMTQLRGTLYSPVKDATGANISSSFGSYGANAVGIETSTDYTDGGKIVLTDETKLRDAIANNAPDFAKLFIGASTTPLTAGKSYIGSSTYNEDGIFKRMDTILRSYVSNPGIGTDGSYSLDGSMNIFVNKQYDFSSTGTSGKNTLPDQVYAKTVSVTNLQTQMAAASSRYYAQFTALETAMNNLNTQQSSLTAMLGTSTSS